MRFDPESLGARGTNPGDNVTFSEHLPPEITGLLKLERHTPGPFPVGKLGLEDGVGERATRDARGGGQCQSKKIVRKIRDDARIPTNTDTVEKAKYNQRLGGYLP